MDTTAIIYTDGSCHTQTLEGGWAAIIMAGNGEVTLSGKAAGTTHHRMELTAVISAIAYVREHYKNIHTLHIYPDSQYVIGLIARKEKLIAGNFLTKKGTSIRNADLVKTFLQLIAGENIVFTKVKAHGDDMYNSMADKLSRSIMRLA